MRIYLDPVPHDGHLVQGRLSIKDDDVIVSEMPLYGVPILQGQAVLVADVPKVHPHSIVPYNIPTSTEHDPQVSCV